MGKHDNTGFTIIETMLVLAVTGVLIAGLLVGIGSSIGVQRYKDAVSTLKSQVQAQYAEVEFVTNDRDATWTCGSTAVPAQNGTGVAPGQSECIVLGRYMTIVGGDIQTATVVGYQTGSSAAANDVASIIADYTLGISTNTIESSSLEWGARIAWPVSGTGSRPSDTGTRSIAILLLRSPDSGTTYTFTSDTVVPIDGVSSDTLEEMMIANTGTVPGQMARTICIDPSGVVVPEKLALYIASAANGASSVEARSDGVIASLGGDTKCN